MDEDLSRKIIVVGASGRLRDYQMLGRCTRSLPATPVVTVNVGTIGHIDYCGLESRLEATQYGILNDPAVGPDAWPSLTTRELLEELNSALTTERMKDVLIVDDMEFVLHPRLLALDERHVVRAAPRRNVPQGKGKSRLAKQNRWK